MARLAWSARDIIVGLDPDEPRQKLISSTIRMGDEDTTRHESERVSRHPIVIDASPSVNLWGASEVGEVVSEIASDPHVAEALKLAMEVAQGLA